METDATNKPAAAERGPMVLHSRDLPRWLESMGCGLALTTYQAGRLILIGRRPDGGLRVHERFLQQCQGLWTDGRTLWVSGLHTLWRFQDDLAGRVTAAGVDRLFVPREGRITGRIDIHDIAVGDTGQFGGPAGHGPIFVATAFNCLATVSDAASFRPLWHPPFIDGIVGEDRCHLNGLAMDGGRAAYVSAVSRSDVADGWREHRRDGGLILDVASGEVVASGLSMPHSPRLHDGRLWVLNSGRGELCIVDPRDGSLTPVAFCPGYARGLAFVGRHAVIGLSRPRRNQTFEGLELDARMAQKGAVARSGLIVVDIDTGLTVEWLRFEHTLDELYDVAVIPGASQSEAIGFRGEEIGQRVRIDRGPGPAAA